MFPAKSSNVLYPCENENLNIFTGCLSWNLQEILLKCSALYVPICILSKIFNKAQGNHCIILLLWAEKLVFSYKTLCVTETTVEKYTPSRHSWNNKMCIQCNWQKIFTIRIFILTVFTQHSVYWNVVLSVFYSLCWIPAVYCVNSYCYWFHFSQNVSLKHCFELNVARFKVTMKQ